MIYELCTKNLQSEIFYYLLYTYNLSIYFVVRIYIFLSYVPKCVSMIFQFSIPETLLS